jgi:hypothetical protein
MGRDFPLVQTGHEANPVFGTIIPGFFSGYKADGAWFGPIPVEPGLKKEWSYTCTPSLILHGLLQGEINLFVYYFLFCVNSYA